MGDLSGNCRKASPCPATVSCPRLYVGLADCYKMAFQYTDQANTLLTQLRKYDRQKHKLLYDAAFIYYYYLKDASKAERYLTAYLKTRPKNSKGQSAGSRCGRSSHHRRRQPIQCRRKLAEGHQRKSAKEGLLQGKGRYRQRNPIK